jgi:hypothetical protein
VANFSESLTIRILGDSAHLERELEGVERRIAELDRRFSRFGELNSRFDELSTRINSLARPLTNVSRLLDRVAGQAQRLGQIPITLNVGPAIAALNVLLGMLNVVAARLSALSVGSILAGFGGGGGAGVRMLPRLAEGGLVHGPAGRDRVPALLTAGEFVLRQPVAARLGTDFLEALNQGHSPRGSAERARTGAASGGTHVNNFGGIAIHVSRPADVNSIVRDLRLMGFRLRNRRG